jgi:hypothetical protein
MLTDGKCHSLPQTTPKDLQSVFAAASSAPCARHYRLGGRLNRHRPFERLSVGNNVTRNMARRSRRVEVLHAFRACDGPDSDACRRESLAMARPVHGDLPSTHPRCAVFSRSLGLNDYPGVFNIELTNAVRAFLNPQTCSLLGRPGGATIGKIDRLRSTCLAMTAREGQKHRANLGAPARYRKTTSPKQASADKGR